MIRARLLLAFASTLAMSAPTLAGDQVIYAPPEAWVVKRPPAPQAPAQGDMPIVLEALDVQARQDGAKQSVYSRSLTKILTAQGLQSGNVVFAWQPEYADLTIHKVVIHRGGESIDVLAEGQTFAVLRREQNLEQAMLDGSLTASLFPAGLKTGDTLEVEATTSSANPVLGDHAEFFFGPLNVAAGRIDVSMQWPPDKPMHFAKSQDMPDWKRETRNGFATASLTLENPEVVLPPNQAPFRYAMVRVGEASDFGSWGEVSRIFAPLYEKASQIPIDGPLRAELDKILASTADPQARAGAALRLVQDQVRYVALTMGVGGLVPADANDTWARRYGDCKAKTALLLGLLRELGVAARPVAVRSFGGDMLQDRLPAVGLFDHVLVQASIGGKTYWLDGTRSGDTSLERLDVPDFRWGLPIDGETAALVRITPPPRALPLNEFVIELDGRDGLFGEVPAKVVETLRGDTALGTRMGMASLTGPAREKALREYWREQFDFIEPDQMDFTFDEGLGEGRFTLEGRATLDWNGGYYETDRTGIGYKADFSRTAGAGSDAPFVVAHPFYSKTVETILLPPDFPGGGVAKPVAVDEVVAGIEYKRAARVSDGRFVVERTSRSLSSEFPASEAPAAQKRLRELADSAVYLRLPDTYKPTSSDIAQLSSDSGDADDLIDRGNILLDGGKTSEALTQFDRAVALEPQNQIAWANKGISEAWLGKLAEASVSLDHAAAAGSLTSLVHRARGFIAENRHDWRTSVNEYTAALQLESDDIFSLGHRAIARGAMRDFDLAVADADRTLVQRPKWYEMYSLKFGAAMERGQRDDALAIAQALLTVTEKDPAGIAFAAQFFDALGEREKARSLLGSAAPDDKTAYGALARAQMRDPGDTAGMRADFDRAISLEPDYAPAYLARGGFLFRRGELAAALEDVDRALRLDPRSGDVYLLKANILAKQDRESDAVDVARKVAVALPENGYGHVVAAKIYSHFGMREQALAAIDRALAIHPEAYIYLNRADVMPEDNPAAKIAEIDKALVMQPDMPEAMSSKARLLSRMGDEAAAEKIYDRMVSVLPPDETGYVIQRGLSRWKLGRLEDARRDFALARERAKNAYDFNNLCYAETSGNIDLNAALADCERALQMAPGDAAILDSRGFVHLRLENYANAIRDFDEALAKTPYLSASLLGRAIAKARVGDVDRGRADFTEAKRIQPSIVDEFADMGISIPDALKQAN
jgi:tetratricopeptide (TPR) repeat protein